MARAAEFKIDWFIKLGIRQIEKKRVTVVKFRMDERQQ